MNHGRSRLERAYFLRARGHSRLPLLHGAARGFLDRQNQARVRYERINTETGEEVPWDRIVRGYEYEDGDYVVLTEEDLERAAVEMTRTLELQQFVDADQIAPAFFERPYCMVPHEGAETGYVLLREALAATGKAGIARVVIRSREHLAAVLPEGDALVLNLLRFQQDLRDLSDYDLPHGEPRDYRLTGEEIELAARLIGELSAEWRPEEYHDRYRDAVMALIERKIRAEQAHEMAEPAKPGAIPRTVNFREALQRSLEQSARHQSAAEASRSSSSTSRREKRAG